MQSFLSSKSLTFTQKEKLKLKKDIEKLFLHGKAFSINHIRIVYQFSQGTTFSSKTQIGFSVPKKRFKRAVDRNRIKRLEREAWRLQKDRLLQQIPDSMQLQLFFIYQSNTMPVFPAINNTVDAIITKLGTLIPSSFQPNK